MSESVEIREEELVEVTIRIPKSLLKLLEDQDYFRFDRRYFFEAAIRSLIGGTVGEWDYTELEAFYEKYGEGVDEIYPPGHFIP